jgi:hypothetical protein
MGNGNGKWQGLVSVTNQRSRLIPIIQRGAGGQDRDKVYYFNQLGGIGKKSNMFAPNADGVRLPYQGSNVITPNPPPIPEPEPEPIPTPEPEPEAEFEPEDEI